MSKYQPLQSHLSERRAEEIAITFEEIEAVIGTKLPNAAHVHRARWSNNPSTMS
jgi:hypothetical protein